MGDKRNFAALDWVIGEIGETLKDARQNLEAYVEDTKDSTRIRFCLTHIHQVLGSLQMVEFHGASLLAEEMEALAQAIMNNAVSSAPEAHEVLMRSLLQLPVYLDHIKNQKEDHPALVLPLLNDLRAVRKQSYLSETNLFSPRLESVKTIRGQRHPMTREKEKLVPMLKKLREMFQFSAANILRGIKVEESLAYIEKVTARLELLARGTAAHPTWEVAAALVDGLKRDDIELSVAVRGLMRHLARELRILEERAPAALDHLPRESLLKNLLYYVARAKGNGSKRIEIVRKRYALDTAMLSGSAGASNDGDVFTAPDPEAIRSVVVALQDELNSIKHVLDLSLSGQGSAADLKDILPIIKRVSDTLAVLGIGDLRKHLNEQSEVLAELIENNSCEESQLMGVAGRIVEVEHRLEAVAKVVGKQTDFESLDEREIELDHAKLTVVKECQHGLEQIKEAIVEYISSKWDKSHLENIGGLLKNIRGGLEMVPLSRPAAILESCDQFIQNELINRDEQPGWHALDALADSIASVDYFLERLADDMEGEDAALLDVAEESVRTLGYPVKAQEGVEVVAEQDAAAASAHEAGQDEQTPEGHLEPESLDALNTVGDDAQLSSHEELVLAPETDHDSSRELEADDVAPADEAVDFEETEGTTNAGAEAGEALALGEVDEQQQHSESESVAASQPQTPELDQMAEGVQAGFSSQGANEDLEDEEENDIDDEIIEIFIEEAGEVSETLAEFFPIWRDNQSDSESLSIVRRAFHTLKGSGRMVEAIDIGELAWSIENMLNRVIDGTVTSGPAHSHAIQLVLELLPSLISAFEAKKSNPEPELTEKLMEMANALSEGTTPEEIAQQYSLEQVRQTLASDGATAPPEEQVTEVEEAAPQVQSEETHEAISAIDAFKHDIDEQDDEFIVLREIFLSEAETHLETIKAFIANMEDEAPIYSAPTDDLQRALHTLKGSAKMAQVTPIARMAEPLESFTKELITFQVPLSDDILQLMRDIVQYTYRGLDGIRAGGEAEIPKVEQFVGRAAELRENAVGHLIRHKEAEKDGARQVDPRLLSIFMAEEMRLLLDASEIIEAWEADNSDTDKVRELVDELRTLEEGATLANLPKMAELSRHINAVQSQALNRYLPCNEDLFCILKDSHNALLDMVDAVAAGQNVNDPPEDVISALQSLLDSSSPVPISEDVSNQEAGIDESDGGHAVESHADHAEDEAETSLFDVSDSAIEELAQLDSTASADLQQEEQESVDEDSEDNALMDYVSDMDADAANESEQFAEAVEDDADSLNADELELASSEGEADDGITLAEIHGIPVESEDGIIESSDSEALHLESETSEDDAPIAASEFEVDEDSFAVEFSGDTGDDQEPVSLDDVEEIDLDSLSLAEPESEGQSISFETTETPDEYDDSDALTSDALSPEETAMHIEEAPIEASSVGEGTAAEFSASNESATDSEKVSGEQAVEEARAASEGLDPSENPDLLDNIDSSAEDFDPEILDIFLEEADELCEELDEAIHSWESDWSDSQSVEEIKRALHTLKGGARLAGMNHFADLTHDYETFIIAADSSATDETFFATMHGFQDRMVRAMRAVQALVRGEAYHPPVKREHAPSSADVASAPSDEVDDKSQSLPDSDTSGDADNVVPFSKPAAVPVPSVPSSDEFNMPAVGGAGGQAAHQVAAKKAGPQEVIKVSAELLEELVNLAGETSISRGRLEQYVSDFSLALDEIDGTLFRLQEQLRRLDIETEAQILFRQERMAEHEDFDPLEMDRYSNLQQLSRSLIESASDLVDLKSTLSDKVRDTETLLVQQSRINTNLQEGLMRSRMVPFSRLVPRLRRIVRQVATELGKNVSFELDNIEGELDRSVLEKMIPPFEHMLRNAVDHGIEMPDDRIASGKSESGRIVLTLGREGGDVIIRLADDGRGIDLNRVRAKAIERGLMAEGAELSDSDIMQFILHAGFSTAESVTQISGRGVGMDVVSAEIKQLGGSVKINSKWGKGTEFVIRLPFTVSVNRALMVGLGTDHYAVPLNSIEGIVRVSPFELEHYYTDPDARFEYANEKYQVRYLGMMLNTDARPKLEGQVLPLPVMLVRSAEHTMAIQVDQLMGSREIVVKSLGQQFASVVGLSGATVMGDGSVVVILDTHALVRKEMAMAQIQLIDISQPQKAPEESAKTIMVVDDSVTVRKVTSRFLERQGFDVITAKDGVDALRVLQEQIPDLMLLDIEMPRMDGFEVAKNVRTSSRWKEIPIIMITSRTGDKHREHALSLGVNQYLGKPYQEDVLLENITELVGG